MLSSDSIPQREVIELQNNETNSFEENISLLNLSETEIYNFNEFISILREEMSKQAEADIYVKVK